VNDGVAVVEPGRCVWMVKEKKKIKVCWVIHV
jgi:hypothetical protein